MAQTINIETNQNIIDVCLQEYGDMENLFALHEENAFDEFPRLCAPGDVISLNSASIRKEVVVILKINKPATGSTDRFFELSLGGIGRMSIGRDFKVR